MRKNINFLVILMTSLIVVKGFSQEVKRVDGVLYSVKDGTILNRINENIVTVKLKF